MSLQFIIGNSGAGIIERESRLSGTIKFDNI